jgi:hypothetical protein
MKNEVEFLKDQVKKYNLDSKHRYRNYTYKRFYIMYRLHKCKLTLVEIGKIVNRHHSSILNGIQMHRRWIRTNDRLYANEIAPIIAAANEMDYEDKYKVVTIESCNNINVKIQIPNRFDKDYKFDKYMTIKEIIKELAEII